MRRSNTQKTLRGLYSQTLVTGLMGVLELLVFSIMSRLLTKQEFGYYAIIMSIIMIFRSLAEAGVGASVIQKKGVDSEYLNTAYSLAIVLGLMLTCIIMACSGFLSDIVADGVIRIPLMLLALTILPYSLNSVYRGLFMRKLHFMRFGIFQVLAFSASQTAAIVMAIFGFGLYAIAIGNVLNIVLQNIILRCSIPVALRFSLSKNRVFDILSYGGWLTLSKLMGTVCAQIDKFLISRWMSMADLGGFYRTRSLIDTADSQLGSIFDVTLFPILSGIQDDKAAIQNAYKKGLCLGCVFFSLLFICFFFNAKLIILLFMGEKWQDQILLFRILALSMLFYAFSRFADCFIRSLALVKFAFFDKFSYCLLLIPCLYIGKDYGMVGVAVSAVSVNLISAVLKTVYICYKIDVACRMIMKEVFRGLMANIILFLFGCIYLLLFEQSYVNSIGFAIIFALSVFFLFTFCPGWVGKPYKEEVYPVIMKILRRGTSG